MYVHAVCMRIHIRTDVHGVSSMHPMSTRICMHAYVMRLLCTRRLLLYVYVYVYVYVFIVFMFVFI